MKCFIFIKILLSNEHFENLFIRLIAMDFFSRIFLNTNDKCEIFISVVIQTERWVCVSVRACAHPRVHAGAYVFVKNLYVRFLLHSGSDRRYNPNDEWHSETEEAHGGEQALLSRQERQLTVLVSLQTATVTSTRSLEACALLFKHKS